MVYILDDGMIGYFAGIVEGEGSISIGRYNHKSGEREIYAPRISIVNTEKEILDIFQRCFGGSIGVRKLNPNVFPPNHPRDMEYKPKLVYQWGVSYQKAVFLASLIEPYLRGKRRKLATLIIEMMNKRKISGRTNTRKRLDSDISRDREYYLKAKQINNIKHRGVRYEPRM